MPLSGLTKKLIPRLALTVTDGPGDPYWFSSLVPTGAEEAVFDVSLSHRATADELFTYVDKSVHA